MKKGLVFLLVCLMTLGMFATGAGAAEATGITIALQGEPTTMDTQYPDDGNMRVVTWQLYEPLIKLDAATLEHVPVLATSYEMIDDVTWEFKIRQGVTFHDGSPLTADDVAFSINRIIDVEFGSQIMSDFDTIKEAVVVDAETVRVTTVNPDPILLNRLPKLDIVSKAFTEAHTNDELTLLANGTGPYKLDNWDRGISLSISVYDGYWGDKPSIPSVAYRWIEETSTRMNALKMNEVQLAVNMYPEYVAELPKVFTQPSTESYFFRFNELRGIMVDPNLRLAMQYAIDRQSIADDLFLGYAIPTNGQMDPPNVVGTTESLQPYPYDLDKAKELMATAGYNGEVIQLVSERGRWLKDGEITETVAAMLMEAGFNIEVKFVSWNEWLDTLFDSSKAPDLMFCSNSNEFLDVDRNFSSSFVTGGSQSTLSDPKVDELIEKARYDMDPATRQATYDELNQYLYETPANLNVVVVNEIYGGAANLEWAMRADSRVYVAEMSLS